MSSGQKRMQSNTRERLVSNDFNRLQSFIGADRALFHRRFFMDQYLVDTSCGYAFEPAAITAPLLADVIGGLMVVPVIGTTSVTITGGELVAFFPNTTPDPDDDPCRAIFDAGVSAIGVLVIPPNAGPGARIDVIECQPIEQVEEQDNRDIFDPATGLFTPSLVDKVIAGRLQYRVRSGLAGGGYPGNVNGWLPLAVASVPAGSVSTDTATFWDVRPLIVERAVQPFHAGSILLERGRCIVLADEWTAPGEIRIAGAIDMTHGYYRAAGTLAKGTPTAVMGTGDVKWIDALNVENQSPGFVAVADEPYYVYACFPYDLPRWVRYTENNVLGLGRVPGSMRGIGTVSMVPPTCLGTPSAVIALPLSTGLSGSTTQAAMMVAGDTSGAGAMRGFSVDGRMCILGGLSSGVPIAPTATNINTDSYSLIGNTHYPASARKLRIRVGCNFTGAPAAAFSFGRTVYLKRFVAVDNVAALAASQENAVFDGAGIYTDVFEIEIPMLSSWPATIAAVTRNISVNYFPSAAVVTRVAGTLSIIGWDLGP